MRCGKKRSADDPAIPRPELPRDKKSVFVPIVRRGETGIVVHVGSSFLLHGVRLVRLVTRCHEPHFFGKK